MKEKNVYRKTPIMGWASWNCFRTNINEERMKEQADCLISSGLAACGYEYFNMDDGFFGGRNQDGRVKFCRERFPNGIKVVADYAHFLGLKAGIYTEAGDNTCGFYYDNETENGKGVGLYGYDEQDLVMYLEEFGFDFIKVDWCGGLRMGLNEKERYTKIGEIIDEIRKRTGRCIVYNICCWQFPGAWAAETADSWRTGADIQPVFSSILSQIDYVKPLAKYCGPGHVNDLDMMQIGNGLSLVEEKTHFSMWCMLSAPLIIGCDLTKISSETLEILKNREMIAIHQDRGCFQGFVVKQILNKTGELAGEIWVKELEERNSRKRAVAFLNRSDEELRMNLNLEEAGVGGEILNLRDMWNHKNLPACHNLDVTVEPRGIAVFLAEGECGLLVPDMYAEIGNDISAAVEISGHQPDQYPLNEEQVRELIGKGAVLVDVRSREEYEERHEEGAVNLPNTEIYSRAAELFPDKNQVIITYCVTGKRSSQAVQNLNYLGYKKVYRTCGEL